MSARRSYRTRRRRNWCNQLSVRSTTQRRRPRPLPCGWRGLARNGSIPRMYNSIRRMYE